MPDQDLTGLFYKVGIIELMVAVQKEADPLRACALYEEALTCRIDALMDGRADPAAALRMSEALHRFFEGVARRIRQDR